MEASDGHEERDTVKGTSENSHGSFVDIVLQSTTTPRMRAAKANQRRETLIGIYCNSSPVWPVVILLPIKWEIPIKLSFVVYWLQRGKSTIF